LDDGAVEDPSFQIIHAIYSLECILTNFQNRSANFDIVFFDGEAASLSHHLSLSHS